MSKQLLSSHHDKINTSLKEFTFIKNKDSLKSLIITLLFDIFILCLIGIVFYFTFKKDNSEFYIAFVLFYPVIPLIRIILYFYPKQKTIIISEKTIKFANFWGIMIPKKISWSDISKIYLVSNPQSKFYKPQQQLLFILNNGKHHILFITEAQQPLYKGINSHHNLLEIIELYYAPPIEKILSNNEIYTKSITPDVNINLDKRIGHIAYIALSIMIIAVILLFTIKTISLENANLKWCYLAVTFIVMFITAKYLHNIENISYKIISCILISGTSVFLMFSITYTLPYFIGTPTPLIFTIIAEDNDKQSWQSTANPKLKFTIRTPSKNRIYHKRDQVSKELTVYKTSIGINAIPKNEYQSLFHYF